MRNQQKVELAWTICKNIAIRKMVFDLVVHATCNWAFILMQLLIQEALLPNIPAGSILIMDSTAFHKRNDIQQLVTRSGHMIECLPIYSPDLNDINRLKRKNWEEN